MTGSWKHIEHEHIKPLLRRLWPSRKVSYGGIRVHYNHRLDGGGRKFGQEFISLLRSFGMPKQPRVYEWCSGPAFIAFSMLGHGLCETLCLADINPEAVEICWRTVRDNGLTDRVAVYQSDNLKHIPPSEQWDLVVSNPPHFDDEYAHDLRCYDADWHIHREFFAGVGAFLKPGGVIVLQENNRGSTVEVFRQMIEQAGLSIVFVHGCAPQRTTEHLFYYIGIMRKGDAAPTWVERAAQADAHSATAS